ncbi:MAG: hypothetical protein KGO82_01945 [Bacteroidota bacterium]|nr:hypothetical protein [Bacteroidota bacterium]
MQPDRRNQQLVLSLVVALIALAFLYVYAQPNCEPCLPNTDCPACISATQITALSLAALIVLFGTGYFLFSKPRTKSVHP